MSQSFQICIHISKLGLWVEFLGDFFYGVEINQLNLKPFIIFKKKDDIPSKFYLIHFSVINA